MKTQAWGWLAAGVVALGVNGFYQDGGFASAHQLVDRVESRSAAVLALASGQAERFLAEARIVRAQNEEREEAQADSESTQVADSMAHVQMTIARTRSEFDRWEVMSTRQEAQAERAAAAQVRVQAAEARMACRRLPAVTLSPVVFRELRIQACPRIRVNVPRITRVEMPAIRIPEINIPKISIPRIEIPQVQIPNINIPKISVPAIPPVHIEMSGAGPV